MDEKVLKEKVVIAIIIVSSDDGELLMTRPHSIDNDQEWGFPCVIVEHDEELSYAAARAAKLAIDVDLLETNTLVYSCFIESQVFVGFLFYCGSAISVQDIPFNPKNDSRFFPLCHLPFDMNEFTSKLVRQ